MPSESRSRNGCRNTAPSSFEPGNRASTGFLPAQLFAQPVQQAFSDNDYALWRIDRATYSNFG